MRELAAFDSRLEATVFSQLLDSNGIPYILQANDASGLYPTNVGRGSVQIFVSDDDYVRASEFVDE